MPISPSAAAPRIASVIAWASTSASEWPSSPNSHGTVTPPRISGRPGDDAMHVPAEPGADLAQDRGRLRCSQEEPRQVHVAGLGDLDVAVAAQHDADFHVQPLHQARFVGADEAVGARRVEGPRQQIVAEHLRRLRQHQLLARDASTRTRTLPVPRVTCFTVSTGTIPTIAAPVAAASSNTLSIVSRSMNGRTASCTATRSVSGVERRQRVLHRLLPAVRRLPRRAPCLSNSSAPACRATHSRSSARTATTISVHRGAARRTCGPYGSGSASHRAA